MVNMHNWTIFSELVNDSTKITCTENVLIPIFPLISDPATGSWWPWSTWAASRHQFDSTKQSG